MFIVQVSDTSCSDHVVVFIQRHHSLPSKSYDASCVATYSRAFRLFERLVALVAGPQPLRRLCLSYPSIRSATVSNGERYFFLYIASYVRTGSVFLTRVLHFLQLYFDKTFCLRRYVFFGPVRFCTGLSCS